MENGQNSPGWIDTRLDAYDPPCPEERFTSANAFAALVHAWDLLRLVLVRFWTPQQLANLPHIRQARRLEFLDWLQPLELMLRRMLFIEAAALASPDFQKFSQGLAIKKVIVIAGRLVNVVVG